MKTRKVNIWQISKTFTSLNLVEGVNLVMDLVIQSTLDISNT